MYTIKETGLQYRELTTSIVKFESTKGHTIAFVTRPLTYTVEVVTVPNPFTSGTTEEEHKVYVDDITPEEVADGIRAVRDLKLQEVCWVRDRHLDEVALGVTTTLTNEQYLEVLQYMQELRDLPVQVGFPHEFQWPVLQTQV